MERSPAGTKRFQHAVQAAESLMIRHAAQDPGAVQGGGAGSVLDLSAEVPERLEDLVGRLDPWAVLQLELEIGD